MKIIVTLKAILETNTSAEISSDCRSVIIAEDDHLVINPYDEHALEEAIVIKEDTGCEVIAITVGDEKCKQILRTALALGADSAYFIKVTYDNGLSPKQISDIIAALIKDLSADIVLSGKQSVDECSAQVPERVAEILGIPHLSAISSIKLQYGSASVERVIAGCRLTQQVELPALFTVEKGINVPRYPSLPDILKSNRKEILELSIEELLGKESSLDRSFEIESISYELSSRTPVIINGNLQFQVSELVSHLIDSGLIGVMNR